MDDAIALLRLQVEWGADEAIDALPVDRFMPGAAMPATVAKPAAPAPRITGTPASRAAALASQATTLSELREAIAGFDGCALRDTASNLVFAEGDPSSPTLVVGDPPGREEDRSGLPFSGAEGHLLDQMLASI